MKTLRLMTLFVFLLVSGCAQAPSGTVTHTAVALPTATAISTSTSTAMPTPSATGTATPPPLPTETVPPASLSALQTQTVLTGDIDYAQPKLKSCYEPNEVFAFSPSKMWQIAGCMSTNPNDGVITQIALMDGSQVWRVSHKDVYIEPYHLDSADRQKYLNKIFLPVRWTKNEDFVYLQSWPSLRYPYWGSYGLFRLDLNTGKITSTLRPSFEPETAVYTFEFSPSLTKLAYINQSAFPLMLVIQNQVSGEESKIKLDARFMQAGNMVWSADGEQLIVGAVYEDKDKHLRSSIMFYNLETFEYQYLIQDADVIYWPLYWIDASTLAAQDSLGRSVHIDVTSKQISIIPNSTPKP